MTSMQKHACRIAAITALSLGLAACGKNDGDTAGQKLDSAIEQTQKAADSAGQKIENSAERAGAATSQALDKAGEQIQSGAEKAADATTNALEKAGAALDDAGITAAVKTRLIGDPGISALKIDVDTKAGVVTLTGTAPNEAVKEQAGKVAAESKGVVSVNNNLTIQP